MGQLFDFQFMKEYCLTKSDGERCRARLNFCSQRRFDLNHFACSSSSQILIHSPLFRDKNGCKASTAFNSRISKTSLCLSNFKRI